MSPSWRGSRQVSAPLSATWASRGSAAAESGVALSSGRRSFNDPLKARPMGERAVATMTASGTGPPGVRAPALEHRSGSTPETTLRYGTVSGPPAPAPHSAGDRSLGDVLGLGRG